MGDIRLPDKGNQIISQERGYPALLSSLLVMIFVSFYPGFCKTSWCWPPEGTYMGFGTAQTVLSSDHPAIGSVNGGGYQVFFGRYGISSLSGEILISGGLKFPTGPVPSPFYPEDSAEYGYIMFGGRYHLTDPERKKFSPWLGLGWSWHSVTWDTYFYSIDGTSITPYAGVDIFPGAWGGLLRVEVKWHSFSTSSGWYGGNYDADVEEYNLSFGYVFR